MAGGYAFVRTPWCADGSPPWTLLTACGTPRGGAHAAPRLSRVPGTGRMRVEHRPLLPHQPTSDFQVSPGVAPWQVLTPGGKEAR